jgi:hypothetical protein
VWRVNDDLFPCHFHLSVHLNTGPSYPSKHTSDMTPTICNPIVLDRSAASEKGWRVFCGLRVYFSFFRGHFTLLFFAFPFTFSRPSSMSFLSCQDCFPPRSKYPLISHRMCCAVCLRNFLFIRASIKAPTYQPFPGTSETALAVQLWTGKHGFKSCTRHACPQFLPHCAAVGGVTKQPHTSSSIAAIFQQPDTLSKTIRGTYQTTGSY